ncbi:MAG: rod shape-determining protein MreC [Bacteroidales bacterium]|nr:rod shape-determining protein MreC [Bacteroidales bacterium]
MRNLLNFLAKYNHLIVFIILESIALYMLGTANSYHNTRIVRGIRGLAGGFERRVSNVRSYFHLRTISQSLARENALLRTSLDRYRGEQGKVFFSVTDTVLSQRYTYTSAQVINNSVNRQKNFFTVDKGRLHGITPDMAVIADNAAAGIIVGCSDNYSVAMSLLNLDFRLSARFRSNSYFGSLSWDGRDDRHAVLSEIPQHVTFGLGDTIETTGYSAVFPEGVLIGTVSDFEKTGGDFFTIGVLLANDFRQIRHVTVIGSLMKEEQLELENLYK